MEKRLLDPSSIEPESDFDPRVIEREASRDERGQRIVKGVEAVIKLTKGKRGGKVEKKGGERA